MARKLSEQSIQILEATIEKARGIPSPPIFGSLYQFSKWLHSLEYFHDMEERRIRLAVYRLEQAGLLKYEHNKVDLTPKGYEVVQKYDFDKLKLKRPQQWDGIWRIIIWDIPEKKRSTRDVIRRKLRDLKFARIQRSTWITPLPCRDEIAFIKNKFKLNTELIYLESNYIEGEQSLCEWFKISK